VVRLRSAFTALDGAVSLKGQAVQFEVVKGKKSWQAENVQVL